MRLLHSVSLLPLTFALLGCATLQLQSPSGETVDVKVRTSDGMPTHLSYKLADVSCKGRWTRESSVITCSDGTETDILLFEPASRPVGVAVNGRGQIYSVNQPFVGFAPHFGCIDESIAYASAMARCEQEEDPDIDCDKENSEEAAAEIACLMRSIEALRPTLIKFIGRRPIPPPPPMQ